jgi:hypothetical protein
VDERRGSRHGGPAEANELTIEHHGAGSAAGREAISRRVKKALAKALDLRLGNRTARANRRVG